MHERGDVDTYADDAKTVFINLELCDERRGTTLETTLVLASLNGILKCSNPLLDLGPSDVRRHRSAAGAIAMAVAALYRLPSVELAVDIADALNEPCQRLEGRPFVNFVDL